jgi:cytochrome c oxidase subunit 2
MKMLIQTRLLANNWAKKILLMCITTLLPFAILAQEVSDVVQPPKEFDPKGWDWVLITSSVLVILILLVVAKAFDIGALTEKLTGKKVIGWTKINAWMAVIFLIGSAVGIAYEMVYHGKYVLVGDSMSEHGATIDSMFNWTFGFTFVVFVITEFLLFWFMFRYPYKEGKKALYYYHNNKLELIWTVIPAIVLTFLVLRGFNTWSRITDKSSIGKDAREIEIYGFQFGWSARYAGADNKFGESNFTLISGTNPLGLAVEAQADSLVKELNEAIYGVASDSINKPGIIRLIRHADDSTAAWVAQLKAYEALQNTRAYPEKYKTIKTRAEEAESGAYKRNLEKDLKRKQTNLARIAEYRKSKAFFNGAANDDKITTEIVLVKGKQYVFKFRARDVIHSAYMPDFRQQMNVVPGMATQFQFVPIKTTAEVRAAKGDKEYDFFLYCNKICGAAHYNMKIKVTIVGTEKEYTDWLATQAPVVAPPMPETPVVPEKKADSATMSNTVATK